MIYTESMKHETKYGDITTIANEVGMSSVTVRKALGYEIDTAAGRMIRDYADFYFRQRDQRKRYLETYVKPKYYTNDKGK